MVTFGPVVSEEKSFESVDGRRTDDGGFPYYKLPQSLRLRGAKNVGGAIVLVLSALSVNALYLYQVLPNMS